MGLLWQVDTLRTELRDLETSIQIDVNALLAINIFDDHNAYCTAVLCQIIHLPTG